MTHHWIVRRPLAWLLATVVWLGPAVCMPQCPDREIVAAGLAPCDLFGFSIACEGNQMVVGAPRSSLAAGAGGAAYVFRRRNGVWLEAQVLLSSQPTFLEQFGCNVELADGTMMVSGDRDPTNTFGSVYVFEEVGGAWLETQRIAGTTLGFGEDIWLEGNRAFIVAPGQAVHEFEFDGSTWTEVSVVLEQALLPFTLPGLANFAGRVAVDGDTMVLGHQGSAPAHVLVKTGGSWQAVAELSGGGVFESPPVAIAGEWILVGSERQNLQAGAVWAYQRTGPATWAHTDTLEASSRGCACTPCPATTRLYDRRPEDGSFVRGPSSRSARSRRTSIPTLRLGVVERIAQDDRNHDNDGHPLVTADDKADKGDPRYRLHQKGVIFRSHGEHPLLSFLPQPSTREKGDSEW
ncbi:MAG: hypothetical protein GY711_17965 [bacterium]|nr:hypothetical protein [bacterium]